MAGAYCKFCGRRCFVARQVIVGGELVWSGHMATCDRGKEHDRRALGMDYRTAHNPVWDGCTCASVCGPKKLEPAADRCPRCQEPLSSPAEVEQHNRDVHGVGPVASTSWGAEP